MREKEERMREKRKMESEWERGRERGERGRLSSSRLFGHDGKGSSSHDGIISVARGIVERGEEKEEKEIERTWERSSPRGYLATELISVARRREERRRG